MQSLAAARGVKLTLFSSWLTPIQADMGTSAAPFRGQADLPVQFRTPVSQVLKLAPFPDKTAPHGTSLRITGAHPARPVHKPFHGRLVPRVWTSDVP